LAWHLREHQSAHITDDNCALSGGPDKVEEKKWPTIQSPTSQNMDQKIHTPSSLPNINVAKNVNPNDTNDGAHGNF